MPLDHWRCSDCLFFNAQPDDADIGTCHARAPQAGNVRIDSAENRFDAYWPRVLSHEWCGKFKPAPTED